MVAAEQAEGEIPGGTVVLGRYQVLGKLAQGGMAEVYLARQVGPGGYQKLVVTKRVRPHLSKDEDFVGMFVNEARLAAMINHPNVVQIFDLGEEPAQEGPGSDWFLAMEYLDGRDMLQVGRACRSHNKAVPFDVTARIIADACAGLEHAHQLKGQDGKILDLVHRDMSPENIIITFEGQVKVVDFGIAKAADNSIRTQAGQIKGKLGYVAPEAILGKPVDARADIFAVGATLYLFLSGRPAFTGSSPMEIFERSLKTPPSPQEVNPRVPPVLDEICMKALAQDRDKRYRSAGEVRAALDAYLSSTGRPLGAPQLAQFMRILFPPDKDPV
ncbi:MAG TPA: serine/threonine-protein kinase, partial [Myxococcota bacterium]